MEQSASVYLWAVREFGDAKLGDARLTQRLITVVVGAATKIGYALSCVCGKSGSQATTRLFGKPQTTLEAVLETHINRTIERCSREQLVLAVHDTTSLDYTTHPCTSGLGPVTTAKHSRGLLMHSVLAVGVDRVPLGLLGMQIWARDESKRGCSKDRRSRKTADKESNKWLVGLRQVSSSLAGDVRAILIGDRESDVYDLFVEPRAGNVDLLVRLAQDRLIDDEDHRRIREAIAAKESMGLHRVELPRQKNRPKRVASLEMRSARVTVKRPAGRSKDLAESVDLYVVWAREIDAPDGVEAVDWLLLTTLCVDDFESAVRLVEFYSTRWVIEEFHRVLKDGCKAERMQYDSVQRIKPALAILAVVAWRVVRLTKLSRTAPNADVSEVANADEVSVLGQWLKSQGGKSEMDTVKSFTIALARLGGFMGRKSDGMPGTKTIWQGLRNLEFLLLGHRLATQQKM